VHEAHKNPIYGSRSKRWFERRWVQELVGSGPPAIVAAVGAYNAQHLNAVIACTLLAAGVWLVLSQALKIFQAAYADRRDNDEQAHEGLVAALHVLHAMACHTWEQSAASDPRMRMTFQRVVPPVGNHAEHMEQVVPYIGHGGGGEGRMFSIRSGIAGKACRTGEVCLMKRESLSEAAYRDELVADWHYTRSDVKTITPDRFAAMAVPIKDRGGQRVLGVVYFDSCQKACFDGETMLNLLFVGCDGLNSFVKERYV